MNDYERLLVFFFAIGAISIFIKSVYEVTKKKNPYGLARYGLIYGGFVYADHLIFGAFWAILSFVLIFMSDFLLFLLTFSVFWLVRSFGESLYWFLQQFSTLVYKNPPERFFIHRYVKPADAIWFMNQIFWQCMTVIFAITTIYLTTSWIKTLP